MAASGVRARPRQIRIAAIIGVTAVATLASAVLG
jgi:hypothetical protein